MYFYFYHTSFTTIKQFCLLSAEKSLELRQITFCQKPFHFRNIYTNTICKATRINIKSMSIFYSLVYINSWSQKFISKKNITRTQVVLLEVCFFLFLKNLHEHQNAENQFRQTKNPTKKKPTTKQKTAIHWNKRWIKYSQACKHFKPLFTGSVY